MANFEPPQLRNRLIDFDTTWNLELPYEDHPPCKISFRSDSVGGLGEYPVCDYQVSFFVFLFSSLRHAYRSHRWTDLDDLYVIWRLSSTWFRYKWLKWLVTQHQKVVESSHMVKVFPGTMQFRVIASHAFDWHWGYGTSYKLEGGLKWVTMLVTGSIARSANLPVFSLLRGQFWGFSTRRGDTLHRWGWNLARKRGPKVTFSVPNFTPIGATTRV